MCLLFILIIGAYRVLALGLFYYTTASKVFFSLVKIIARVSSKETGRGLLIRVGKGKGFRVILVFSF